MKTNRHSCRVFVTCLYAVLSLCVLCACDDKSVSARRKGDALFSLQVKKIVDPGDLFSQTPGQNTYHVVVSDSAGRTLGFEKLASNTELAFEKPDGFTGKEISVSFVYRSASHYVFVNTLQNVPVGSAWRMYPLEDIRSRIGQPANPATYKATLRVTNVPAGIASLYSSAITVFNAGQPLKPDTDYPMVLAKNTASDIWLALSFNDRNRANRFFLLRNAQPDGTYTVDLSSFSQGTPVSLALPASGYEVNTANVWAYNQADQIRLYDHLLDTKPDEIRKPAASLLFSRPEGSFDKYGMYVQITRPLSGQSAAYNDERYNSYHTSAALPSSLPILPADFSLQAANGQECRFASNGTSHAYTVSWQNADPNAQKPSAVAPYVFWSVSGRPQATLTVRMPALPLQVLPNGLSTLRCTSISLAKAVRHTNWQSVLDANWNEDLPSGTVTDWSEYSLTRSLK